MMEGGVEVKRLILARSRLPPEEVSGRVVSGRSSALLLLVIYNIIVIVTIASNIIFVVIFRSSQGGPTAVPGMLVRSSVGRSVQRHKYCQYWYWRKFQYQYKYLLCSGINILNGTFTATAARTCLSSLTKTSFSRPSAFTSDSRARC